CARASRGFDYW
nr:immunoglobulin heavy chain junction region [Macaca mulatta]MOX03107.1 immunoglobulin heavy chain junction region [Macaca mulatta]MOX04432.1 immunoglobulin heavy chain junction region [Macaca mulatta]MOX05628.1 immunoglobulin heavy chain junction region [Macaca mulatta]MOX05833.1 immunoglobulin heavy chain junction region [Macaca mulatta]